MAIITTVPYTVKSNRIQNSQVYLTIAATLYIAALLLWEHMHGGVVSHHILHRSDLPSISNWWGGLIIPVLTWFLAGRINRQENGLNAKPVIIRLVGAMLYGILLSVAYFKGIEPLSSLMAPGLLVLALFIRIYKAEYILGFILSMTFAFGAILPTVFAIVMALLGFLIYTYIRPIPVYLLKTISRAKGGGKDSVK